MENQEKVIQGLEAAAEYFRQCRSNASMGSKAENHFFELQSDMTDAMEMLQALDKENRELREKLEGVRRLIEKYDQV